MNVSASNQGGLHRLKQNPIVQAWLVLLLAVCFGASLAGVHLKLAPVIETNKRNETLQQVPQLVLGNPGPSQWPIKGGIVITRFMRRTASRS